MGGTCLACHTFIGPERGIYPAGTPALQIRGGKSQGPFANLPSCGLKSALLSSFQAGRKTHTVGEKVPGGRTIEFRQGCKTEGAFHDRTRSPAAPIDPPRIPPTDAVRRIESLPDDRRRHRAASRASGDGTRLAERLPRGRGRGRTI